MADEAERHPFFRGPLPPGFRRHVISVELGECRLYEEAQWRDAIVLIERGEIELEGRSGFRWRFGRGDIVWLVGVPLRALRNSGREPAILIAIARADSNLDGGAYP